MRVICDSTVKNVEAEPIFEGWVGLHLDCGRYMYMHMYSVSCRYACSTGSPTNPAGG